MVTSITIDVYGYFNDDPLLLLAYMDIPNIDPLLLFTSIDISNGAPSYYLRIWACIMVTLCYYLRIRHL